MVNRQILIDYWEYDSLEELPAEGRELMEAAIAATATAYAPYSGFRVGAAVRLADGTVVTGSNQENAAYPSGLCAERTALFGASAQKPAEAVTALAVAGRDREGRLTEASPCGACRQVLADYEGRYGTRVTVYTLLKEGRIRRTEGVKSLLPFLFEAAL